VSNALFFDFRLLGKVFSSGACKTYPGDAVWFTTDTWNTLNLVTGGALLILSRSGLCIIKENTIMQYSSRGGFDGTRR
jgi:hypothetical protein